MRFTNEKVECEQLLEPCLGVMLVTTGENQEDISFAYPISGSQSTLKDSIQTPPPDRVLSVDGKLDRGDALLYGAPARILAHLLSAKGNYDKFFEIKIDNLRFAGFPKMVTNVCGRSPQIFHLVFVMIANIPAHIVQSFQILSKKLALAIDEEQSRCGYLAEQMSIMLNEHDKFDSLMNCDIYFTYGEILKRSRLACEISDVFNYICEYGSVHKFINNVVEVGFCLLPRALLHAGLSPRSRNDIEKIVKRIRPYHGLLLIDNELPNPSYNPSLKILFDHYRPNRSIVQISHHSGLSIVQTLLIIRHLLLWARAIIIYPLRDTNVYSSAVHQRLNFKFQEDDFVFGEIPLPIIIAQFSPPCTLVDFQKMDMFSQLQNKDLPYQIVARLLRDGLVMQLHTYIYLLPPFSDQSHNIDELDLLENSDLRNLIINMPILTEVKDALRFHCCNLIKSYSTRRVRQLLLIFIEMIPYFNGEHHLEDISYRTNIPRHFVLHLVDIFSVVLQTFVCPEFIMD